MKSNYDGLIEAVREGNVHSVEGPVEAFHPMPAAGHDTERFTVQGTAFAYSDYESLGAFNNSASHGGPLRSGLPVRITYVATGGRNLIVRLEVGRAPNRVAGGI
jgi:hypothetical protein